VRSWLRVQFHVWCTRTPSALRASSSRSRLTRFPAACAISAAASSSVAASFCAAERAE
jgi:hypothetical protein